jgi:hypothetical protein
LNGKNVDKGYKRADPMKLNYVFFCGEEWVGVKMAADEAYPLATLQHRV